jgi:hypothetical protein
MLNKEFRITNSQIPNHKHQIPNKFPLPKFKNAYALDSAQTKLEGWDIPQAA